MVVPHCASTLSRHRHTFAHQRDTKDVRKSPKPLAFSQGIFWISLNVTYLNRLALGDSTSKHRAATRDSRSDSAAIAQMGNSYPYAASYGYSREYKVAPMREP